MGSGSSFWDLGHRLHPHTPRRRHSPTDSVPGPAGFHNVGRVELTVQHETGHTDLWARLPLSCRREMARAHPTYPRAGLPPPPPPQHRTRDQQRRAGHSASHVGRALTVRTVPLPVHGGPHALPHFVTYHCHGHLQGRGRVRRNAPP
ncbi:hypothetical protein HYPSUDRAFT_210422 [Hypholoma sublateritium FD-334 SS-4]|uniref:Uncharacterized protein n=1 Tax=Hypholoma sublateritium (strain FD-334 SS-4) TaxID=945553 RepID=A0A0D2MZZ0_HYPSF|nr:hypothetical protein HYPSUDRAFT_210422 [Hypholoma sublateritium FD-334 SS-4]